MVKRSNNLGAIAFFSYADGSHRDEGHEPGDCVCKEGYAGAKCTECAKGFHDYPKVRDKRREVTALLSVFYCTDAMPTDNIPSGYNPNSEYNVN